MAQTGDVKFGNKKNLNLKQVGTGSSDLPNLKAEFNSRKHVRGACSMARSSDPHSANSQFFICYKDAPSLNGQYTVWGQVIEGMHYLDKIEKGSTLRNGLVRNPDHMLRVTVGPSYGKGRKLNEAELKELREATEKMKQARTEWALDQELKKSQAEKSDTNEETEITPSLFTPGAISLELGNIPFGKTKSELGLFGKDEMPFLKERRATIGREIHSST